MGASIAIYWPGITADDLAEDFGFQNDDRAWANWIVAVDSDPALKTHLSRLGIDELATFTTDGMKDQDVNWVSPDALSNAAAKLIEWIDASDPRITPIVTAYGKGANKLAPVDQELRLDLEDIMLRVRVAQRNKIPKMTLSVNW